MFSLPNTEHRPTTEEKVRRTRRHQRITEGRQFHAQVVSQPNNAAQFYLPWPYDLVFYSDGSEKEHPGTQDFHLTAAIAWKKSSSDTFKTDSIYLGCTYGNSEDAELAGILLAVETAVWKLRNERDLRSTARRVVVVSDAREVLRKLALGTVTDTQRGCIGPSPDDQCKWPLEKLYDMADELHQMQILLEIHWQKGHSSYNPGNQAADQAARDEMARYIPDPSAATPSAPPHWNGLNATATAFQPDPLTNYGHSYTQPCYQAQSLTPYENYPPSRSYTSSSYQQPSASQQQSTTYRTRPSTTYGTQPSATYGYHYNSPHPSYRYG